MRVCLDDGALLQEDLSHHRAVAVDETSLDLRGHALFRNLVPAVMRSKLHCSPPLNAETLPVARPSAFRSGTIKAASPPRRCICTTCFASFARSSSASSPGSGRCPSGGVAQLVGSLNRPHEVRGSSHPSPPAA